MIYCAHLLSLFQVGDVSLRFLATLRVSVSAATEDVTSSSDMITFSNSSWEDKQRPDCVYANLYKIALFSTPNSEDGERLWSQTKSVARYINYTGHSYFGCVYYQSTRKSGYRQLDGFIYSALMSTFYWEYGIEAFAEMPAYR